MPPNTGWNGKIVKTPDLGGKDQITKLRLGFDILAEYCQTHHYPLVVVSAGLDFVIKHLLMRENLIDKVKWTET